MRVNPRKFNFFPPVLAGLIAGVLLILQYASAQAVDVALFSQGDISGWEEESFVGNTSYQLVNADDGSCLQAVTDASASGLFREIEIDLTETPYLNWSWKVENTYDDNNEMVREGDDYPVRIFVVASGGIFFWNTLALNYTWSSNQPIGSVWESALTRNAMMIAVASGNDDLGQWVSEKRNIREDFATYFGEDIDSIDAIAVMSDSDNTGQRATACYGDISFSAQ